MAEETGHQAHAHPEPNYLAIWGYLSLLTVLEIAAVKMGLPRALLIFSLVIMALAKAALVALFFMHLKFERQMLKVIAVVPLVVGTILLIGVIPDALRALGLR